MLHWPWIRSNRKPKDDATEDGRSLLVRFKGRLLDRSCFPRSWWFPTIRTLEFGEPAEWKRQHDEVSNTLRRVMLTLVGYSLFCMLTLGAPDELLIVGSAKIKVPFAGTEVDYVSFLIIGPLILLGLSAYLHIFLAQWLTLGARQNSSRLPYLFNMKHRGASFFARFTFYWLPPAVLAIFTWKALPRPDEAVWLICLTTAVAIGMLWLQIRRCFVARRRRNIPLWLFLGIVLFCFPMVVIETANPHGSIYRSLQLHRVNLSEKYLLNAPLARANLNGADMSKANLSGANLSRANLRGANLVGANLGGANLIGAGLRWANLSEAFLSNADLSYANLSYANLSNADLDNASLTGADLTGADLTGAKIRQDQLNNACGVRVELPPDLVVEPCTEEDKK